jgi:hypothetical protein
VEKFLIGERLGNQLAMITNSPADRAERYHYSPDDIVMLTDDARNPRQIPTRANMIQAMHWLVQGAQPNDALFFH